MRPALLLTVLFVMALVPAQAAPPDPCRPHCRAEYVGGLAGAGSLAAAGGRCDPEEVGIAQVCVPIYAADLEVRIDVVDDELDSVGASYSFFDDQQVRTSSSFFCGGPLAVPVPEGTAYLRVYLGSPVGGACASPTSAATQGYVDFAFES